MSNSMESSGGQQFEPSREPKKPPSYERAPEPEPEIDPAVAPDPPTPDPSVPIEEPPAAYTPPPEPTVESVSRRVDELHAAAFAAADPPSEADLMEATRLDDPIEAEEAAAWEAAVAREEEAQAKREAAERARQAARDPRSPAARAAGAGELRPITEDEEKLLATLSHLSVFFLPIIGPLIMLLINQKRSGWVAAQAREAFNFHINMFIWSIISAITAPILIGVCGFFAVGLASIVLPIIGTVQALNGRDFRYPWILRFLR